MIPHHVGWPGQNAHQMWVRKSGRIACNAKPSTVAINCHQPNLRRLWLSWVRSDPKISLQHEIFGSEQFFRFLRESDHLVTVGVRSLCPAQRPSVETAVRGHFPSFMSICAQRSICHKRPELMAVANGPSLPSVPPQFAAPQLSYCCHSCRAQHF